MEIQKRAFRRSTSSKRRIFRQLLQSGLSLEQAREQIQLLSKKKEEILLQKKQSNLPIKKILKEEALQNKAFTLLALAEKQAKEEKLQIHAQKILDYEAYCDRCTAEGEDILGENENDDIFGRDTTEEESDYMEDSPNEEDTIE